MSISVLPFSGDAIAKWLTIKVGKGAGRPPSVASLYRALAEAEAVTVLGLPGAGQSPPASAVPAEAR
ncbi:hypothetical protein ABZ137_22420 [Streptomyces bobili]